MEVLEDVVTVSDTGLVVRHNTDSNIQPNENAVGVGRGRGKGRGRGEGIYSPSIINPGAVRRSMKNLQRKESTTGDGRMARDLINEYMETLKSAVEDNVIAEDAFKNEAENVDVVERVDSDIVLNQAVENENGVDVELTIVERDLDNTAHSVDDTVVSCVTITDESEMGNENEVCSVEIVEEREDSDIIETHEIESKSRVDVELVVVEQDMDDTADSVDNTVVSHVTITDETEIGKENQLCGVEIVCAIIKTGLVARLRG